MPKSPWPLAAPDVKLLVIPGMTACCNTRSLTHVSITKQMSNLGCTPWSCGCTSSRSVPLPSWCAVKDTCAAAGFA